MADPHNHNHSLAVKKPQPPLYVPAGSILFRLLCHHSRIGGVIGKSGSAIKLLQNQTSAKIRVEDSPPGTDERVIVIIAPAAINKFINFGDNTTEMEVSAAQEAVVRVFGRVIDVAAVTGGVGVEAVGVVSCRLLVEGCNVGAVMGKGGKVIEKIRSDTGCRIRVLGHQKVPPCAWPEDEIVEIEGDILAVNKGLVAVSRCLQDSTPVDKQRRVGNRPYEVIPNDPLPNGRWFVPPQQSSVVQPMSPTFPHYASGGRPLTVAAARGPMVDPRPQQRDVVFRMLCSVDTVGGLIGKGGMIIKALQQETGASVIIGPSIPECLERSITITAMESTDSSQSPAQNAAALVFNRLIEAASEKGLDSVFPSVSARLLVSPNQVGCLLGRGGAIVSDMRKATNTSIKIIGDDQVPKCASENDEVVQITGEIINVQHALYVVTGKLRDNLFSSKMSNGAGTRSSSSMTSGITTHEKPRGSPSIGLHPSANAFQIPRHTSIEESMDLLRLNNDYDQPPSPRPLASQQTAAEVNSGDIDDGIQLASVKGGVELGSGSRTAIVMTTTVEIIVPDNIIGSVYGENGSNLTRLRQISGAKVVVHEPRPGTTDRIVVISGTPDEAQVAQSLLQAFILTGRS